MKVKRLGLHGGACWNVLCRADKGLAIGTSAESRCNEAIADK